MEPKIRSDHLEPGFDLCSNSRKMMTQNDQTTPTSKISLEESKYPSEEIPKWEIPENIKHFIEKEIDRIIDSKIEIGRVKIDRRSKSKIPVRSICLDDVK